MILKGTKNIFIPIVSKDEDNFVTKNSFFFYKSRVK